MTLYYRTTDAQIRDLAPADVAALAQTKRDTLRLYIVDAQPVPSASQVVERGPLVVGPIEAHQTWTLRAKTAAELEDDALLAERATLQAAIDALNTQLAMSDAAFAALTAGQKADQLRTETRLAMRAARYLLRRELRRST